VPGADQVVAGRLGRGVQQAGRVGGVLRKRRIVRPEIAVDLVGGDMVEAEGIARLTFQLAPVVAGSLQQVLRARDVGLDERRRPLNRAQSSSIELNRAVDV
jgi:hypothetical protein